MSLVNFGGILNFAEEIEAQDRDFYSRAAAEPALKDRKALFDMFAADAAKNIKLIQRTRRENVTEMILENVQGLAREPFIVSSEGQGAGPITAHYALAFALRIENRAIRFYREAAEKIKVQPEVALALKQLAKKREARLNRLES